ncbi:hypothetical protein PR202_ga20732 [Eleusine coracana subsp. coracana]|uniref:Uncharacterized protein n=1 Tax=Eleusine coracana subsp. coracana TaxID=191504 RepID=A0AAV5CXV4_ELECO|nr:hypothetical protein PR202_ga20732 [Eleusine coracana subsp. coracana]
MKTATTKALAGTLSTLLVLFFFLILCTSSSLSPQSSSSVLRSRRLLSLQCHGASSCSTPLSGLDRFYKAPKAVFDSLKRMPKSRSNPSHN